MTDLEMGFRVSGFCELIWTGLEFDSIEGPFARLPGMTHTNRDGWAAMGHLQLLGLQMRQSVGEACEPRFSCILPSRIGLGRSPAP